MKASDIKDGDSDASVMSNDLFMITPQPTKGKVEKKSLHSYWMEVK